MSPNLGSVTPKSPRHALPSFASKRKSMRVGNSAANWSQRGSSAAQSAHRGQKCKIGGSRTQNQTSWFSTTMAQKSQKYMESSQFSLLCHLLPLKNAGCWTSVPGIAWRMPNQPTRVHHIETNQQVATLSLSTSVKRCKIWGSISEGPPNSPGSSGVKLAAKALVLLEPQ